LRSVSPLLPFYFEVTVEEASFELGATEIELAMEAAANTRPDVIEVRATKANGNLIVRDRLLVVELSGTRAASYDLGDDYAPGEGAEQLAVDYRSRLRLPRKSTPRQARRRPTPASCSLSPRVATPHR
jgi:hypothetical protein